MVRAFCQDGRVWARQTGVEVREGFVARRVRDVIRMIHRPLVLHDVPRLFAMGP